MIPDLAADMELCRQTAAKNRRKYYEAEACQHFSVGCLGCPFVATVEDLKLLERARARRAKGIAPKHGGGRKYTRFVHG